MIAFEVPGPVVPWQRALRAKTGMSYANPMSAHYQRSIALLFGAAVGRDPWSRAGRYRVSIATCFATKHRYDLDNVAKQVGDALNSVAWDDDSQIDEITVKRLPPSKTKAGLSIVITPL